MCKLTILLAVAMYTKIVLLGFFPGPPGRVVPPALFLGVPSALFLGVPSALVPSALFLGVPSALFLGESGSSSLDSPEHDACGKRKAHSR